MSGHAFEDNETPFPEKALADLWNRQETPMTTADPRDREQLLASLEAGHRTEQIRLLWLNVREGLPIALCLAFFAYLGATENRLLYISALLSLAIGLFLVGSSVRQHKIEQRFDATLRGSITRSLSQARHRRWMYHNAGWWYIAPLAVATAILYTWAIVDDPNGAKFGDAVVITLIAAVYLGLSKWTSRVAVTKWQPEVERFEALLAELEDQSSSTR
jgi:hypothetical protein